MPQKKHKPEEIVAKLRQVDVLLSQGRPVAEAIRTISVTPFTYYRWRKEFGGLKSDQVKRRVGTLVAAACVRPLAGSHTRLVSIDRRRVVAWRYGRAAGTGLPKY